MSNKEVFYCYSIKLFHFLKMNGFWYIYKERHPNGRFYWVFEKTDAFKNALDEYETVRDIFN